MKKMEIKCYDYNSVVINYKYTYPWKIPITFKTKEFKKVKKIIFKIQNEDIFKIKIYLLDILKFYSIKKWTAALSKSPFDIFYLNIKIKPINEYIKVNDRIIDENGLHYRGCCERNLFYDNQVNIEISPSSCKEISESKLKDQYEIIRIKEGWEKWTQDGWIKHALAHELAHFICIPELKEEWNSLDEILAQIFSCHYDVISNPIIHVPSGRYLKSRWDIYNIKRKDFDRYNKMLSNVFINSDLWLNNYISNSNFNSCISYSASNHIWKD